MKDDQHLEDLNDNTAPSAVMDERAKGYDADSSLKDEGGLFYGDDDFGRDEEALGDDDSSKTLIHEEEDGAKKGKANPAILAAAGALGLAVLGGAGYVLWDRLHASSKTPAMAVQTQASSEEGVIPDDEEAEVDDGRPPQGQELEERKINEEGVSSEDKANPDEATPSWESPARPSDAASGLSNASGFADPKGAMKEEKPEAVKSPQAAAPLAEAKPKTPSSPKEIKMEMPSDAKTRASTAKDPALATTQQSRPQGEAAEKPKAKKTPSEKASTQGQKPSATASGGKASDQVPKWGGVEREVFQARVMAIYPLSGPFAQAWLRDSTGRVYVVQVGDVLDGAKVTQISSQDMKVRLKDGRVFSAD
ncbi:MAG: hypothetical protein P3W87_003020 [Gammaproteobacteria bacterium]|nr:hypothetical protein [Gammaproteobacteria bacterium]